MIEQYLEEAQMLRETGDYPRAVEVCAKAVETDPKDMRSHFMLGLIALDQTQHRRALDHFAEAARLDPDERDVQLNYGMSLKEFGEFEKARECFERVIEIDPNSSPGYYNLVSTMTIDDKSPLLARLETLINEDFIDNHENSLAHFALGKALDDIGEYDRAFEHFTTANQLQERFYNHQNTLTMFARAKKIFTRELMEKLKGLGNPSQAPIFIIGMPRSGSSLVEDILCRNENIAGYGERTEIAQIVVRLEKTHPSHAPYPEVVEMINGQQFGMLGDLYLQLMSQVMPPAERMVDKNILNHSAAGFIRLMFPNAAIIHTARDPIDSCLSSYFQNFKGGIDYSFDLEDLGKRYAAYSGLMDHWYEVLGDGLFKMQYEDLALDKDNQINRLFDHVGMTRPEASAAEKPADRAIATASAWQARQPIYDSSVKRWKNYEKHLGPMFKALEDSGYHYQES